jgi:hypothetical protein
MAEHWRPVAEIAARPSRVKVGIVFTAAVSNHPRLDETLIEQIPRLVAMIEPEHHRRYRADTSAA